MLGKYRSRRLESRELDPHEGPPLSLPEGLVHETRQLWMLVPRHLLRPTEAPARLAP